MRDDLRQPPETLSPVGLPALVLVDLVHDEHFEEAGRALLDVQVQRPAPRDFGLKVIQRPPTGMGLRRFLLLHQRRPHLAFAIQLLVQFPTHQRLPTCGAHRVGFRLVERCSTQRFQFGRQARALRGVGLQVLLAQGLVCHISRMEDSLARRAFFPRAQLQGVAPGHGRLPARPRLHQGLRRDDY